MATVAVRALLDDDRIAAAIRLGDAALEAGHDSPPLRASLGLAHLRRATEDDRKIHALAHFEAGLAAAPSDVRLLTLHGETLLRAGRYKDAVPPLEQAIALAPELEQTRALYARALRYTQRYDEAADQLLHLVTKSPDKPLWQRSAIGALSQAGRPREAEALFERYVAQRGLRLPPTFREALDQLDERLDSAPIPQARLDWPGRCAATHRPTASTGSAARAGAIWWIIYCSTGSNAARTASKRPCSCWANWTPANGSSRRCWRRAGAWWSPPPTSVPCTPA